MVEVLRTIRAMCRNGKAHGLGQRRHRGAAAANPVQEDDALHAATFCASPKAKLVMLIEPQEKLRWSAWPVPPPAPSAT